MKTDFLGIQLGIVKWSKQKYGSELKVNSKTHEGNTEMESWKGLAKGTKCNQV